MTLGTQYRMVMPLSTIYWSHYIAGDPVLYGDDLRSAIVSDWAAAGKELEYTEGGEELCTSTVVTFK